MPELADFDEPTRVVYRYIHWNKMIEVYTAQKDNIFWKIEQEPYGLLELLAERGLIDLAQIDRSKLFDNRKYNTKRNVAPSAFSLSDITDDQVRQDLLEITERYGYCWRLEMDEKTPTNMQ